ncbi:uncharacterized protein LOC135124329 [Zophobas morio]|uniref:uncharacterized protein LOC135124329 n=1 Tax=Zophobas morio TaxID=2755281 RepID=UPI0030829F3D
MASTTESEVLLETETDRFEHSNTFADENDNKLSLKYKASNTSFLEQIANLVKNEKQEKFWQRVTANVSNEKIKILKLEEPQKITVTNMQDNEDVSDMEETLRERDDAIKTEEFVKDMLEKIVSALPIGPDEGDTSIKDEPQDNVSEENELSINLLQENGTNNIKSELPMDVEIEDDHGKKRPSETDQTLEENPPKRPNCENQGMTTDEQPTLCDNAKTPSEIEDGISCEKSEPNSDLITQMLTLVDKEVSGCWETTSQQPYTLIRVLENTTEYNDVHQIFSRTCRDIKMVKLERVQNLYLFGQFLLKKEKMRMKNGSVQEKQLFHGTREEYVDGICKNNFDWRRCGSSRGHIFGQGVSFSPEVTYARHYSPCSDKVMILTKVLVCMSTVGDSSTVVPPDPYDTTHKSAGTVFVKYEDDDFYPQYVIHFGYKNFYFFYHL